MIKAILFDLDGVLVEAVDIHFQAFNRALKLFGYDMSQTLHDLGYNGLPTRTKLELLSQMKGLPKGLHPFLNEMKQRYTRELLEERLSRSNELRDLLATLKRKGLRLAVASNCVRPTVDLVLKKLEITEFFDVILSADEVKHPKPDPALYQLCLAKLSLKPEECLVIEDSKPGILAAKKTTPNVVVVKNPNGVSLALIEDKVSEFQSAQTGQCIEVLIPMAGEGSRFAKEGYQDPKPLIPVMGKPMIQWVIENLSSEKYRMQFTFLVNSDHADKYRLEERLALMAPGCNVIRISGKTEGAACTTLVAADQLNPHRPLLIANSDQFVNFDIDEFLDAGLKPGTDGSILTFPAENDKKWSFAKTDGKGWVTEVAEKNPISRNATVGIYLFRQSADYLTAAQESIRQEERTNGEFYVCPVYNPLIACGAKIRIHEIHAYQMHSLGTPEDLRAFLALHHAPGPAPRPREMAA